MYSCIESDLQSAITAKKVKYATGTAGNSYQLNSDIHDKIWLFSEKEMRSTATYSGRTTEGLGTSGEAYDKFKNIESKYYSIENNNATETNNNRKACNEAGSEAGWWLRSIYLENKFSPKFVNVDGSCYGSAYIHISGLSFGFCI